MRDEVRISVFDVPLLIPSNEDSLLEIEIEREREKERERERARACGRANRVALFRDFVPFFLSTMAGIHRYP